MRTAVTDQRLSGLISGAVRVRTGTRGEIRARVAVRGGRRAETGVGVTVLRRVRINGMEIWIRYGFGSRLHLGIRARCAGTESRGMIRVPTRIGR